MMPSSADWSVECTPSGREGYVFYHEGSHELPFHWELGGSDTVLIVRFAEPSCFASKYPWAIERKREIFERVAQELIRQQAPLCKADIDVLNLFIYIRERNIGS